MSAVRRSGGTVSTAMVLLGIAIAGVMLTAILYVVVGAIAMWLLFVTGRFVKELVMGPSRRRAAALHAADRESARENPEVLPEEMRDPAWATAVEAKRRYRLKLIEDYSRLKRQQDGLRPLPPGARMSDSIRVTRDMITVKTAVLEEFGELPVKIANVEMDFTVRKQPIYNVSTAPPKSTVFHLDREFRLVTDCRYGHCAMHNVVGQIKPVGDVVARRVIRECEVCAPATRWTELM